MDNGDTGDSSQGALTDEECMPSDLQPAFYSQHCNSQGLLSPPFANEETKS